MYKLVHLHPSDTRRLTYDTAIEICSSVEINGSNTSTVASAKRESKIREFLLANAIMNLSFWISVDPAKLTNDSTKTEKKTCSYLSQHDNFRSQRTRNCSTPLRDPRAVLCERKPESGQYPHRDSAPDVQAPFSPLFPSSSTQARAPTSSSWPAPATTGIHSNNRRRLSRSQTIGIALAVIFGCLGLLTVVLIIRLRNAGKLQHRIDWLRSLINRRGDSCTVARNEIALREICTEV